MKIQNIFLLLRTGMLAPALLLLTACATSAGGYISGQVLDVETKQSIADAAVMIWWEGQESMVVDSQSVCVAADSTTTDADGRFSFPPWIKPTSPLIGRVHYGFFAYKRGYVMHRKGFIDRKTLYMKPFEGSVEQRFNEIRILSSNAARCNAKDERLLPFIKNLYEEASDIAVTREDKITALGLLERIESQELGEEKANRRLEMRWKQLNGK